MSTVIERVAKAQQQAEVDALAFYWATVRAVAGDDDVADAGKLSESRRIIGKSIDDFTADCEAVAQRFKLAENLGKRDALQATIAEAQQQVEAADEALTRAEEKHTAAVAPLDATIEQSRRALREIDQAEERLRRDCPYPWHRERADALEAARLGVYHDVQRMREAITGHQRGVDHLRAQAAGEEPLSEEMAFELTAGPGGILLDRREEAARRRLGELADKRAGRIEGMREDLAKLEAELTRIASEQNAHRAELMKP